MAAAFALDEVLGRCWSLSEAVVGRGALWGLCLVSLAGCSNAEPEEEGR